MTASRMMGTPQRMMAIHAMENGKGSAPASESTRADTRKHQKSDVTLDAAPCKQFLESFDHRLPYPQCAT